jgi:pyruvate dehydrogenase E1 component alpha subunit
VRTTKKEKLLLYGKMLMVRAFEEKAGELHAQNLLPGNVHLSLGQEASSVGTCSVLKDDDYITTTHRGHGHLVAKGGNLNKMFAELMGKATGYCKGKGGSLHIADFSIGILGANGIVGGGFPIIVGAGISIKLRKSKQVGLVFFGDGAANRGTFHEALNMAAVYRLPVIFLCENNLYAGTSPASRFLAGGSVAGRAAAYGIRGYEADGNDIMAVRKTVAKAVERARNGKGPSIVECHTYRYSGHFQGEPQKYRTQKEVEATRKQRDPIEAFKKQLTKEGTLTGKIDKEIRERVINSIESAVQDAADAPYPKPEDALEDIFVNP